MKLLIINGPNLNLLGTREPKIYGSRTFESYLVELREMLDGDEIEYLQSNHEGDIIDFLHNTDADGLIQKYKFVNGSSCYFEVKIVSLSYHTQTPNSP